MLAIREIRKVESNKVTIDLPPEFNERRVEVIVLSIENDADRSLLPELLLDAPTLSPDELGEFEAVRTWMNQWNVNEF